MGDSRPNGSKNNLPVTGRVFKMVFLFPSFNTALSSANEYTAQLDGYTIVRRMPRKFVRYIDTTDGR